MRSKFGDAKIDLLEVHLSISNVTMFTVDYADANSYKFLYFIP